MGATAQQNRQPKLSANPRKLTETNTFLPFAKTGGRLNPH
jgi:hypothetical protein